MNVSAAVSISHIHMKGTALVLLNNLFITKDVRTKETYQNKGPVRKSWRHLMVGLQTVTKMCTGLCMPTYQKGFTLLQR